MLAVPLRGEAPVVGWIRRQCGAQAEVDRLRAEVQRLKQALAAAEAVRLRRAAPEAKTPPLGP